MGYPKHPNIIVIKNEFYPHGLREIDLWNYYQKVKNRILKETMGRDIIFFLATNENETIVKRRGTDRPYIQLNMSNYDDIITGRTVSIHSVIKKYEEFGIIDIDTDDFNQAKDAVIDVYNVMFKAPFVDSIKIRFTGKSSFHIILNYKRKLLVDGARGMIEEYLKKSSLINQYTIEHQKTSKVPNLDLYRNVYNAGYITLYSLSVLGLVCMEVPLRHIRTFGKNQAKI